MDGDNAVQVSPIELAFGDSLTIFENDLYFVGRDATVPDSGSSLWKFDGSEFEEAWRPTESRWGFVSNLVPYNGRLYSLSNDTVHGEELWSWDGTKPRLVADLFPGPLGINFGDPFFMQMLEYDGSLFISIPRADGGSELWSLTIPEPSPVSLFLVVGLVAGGYRSGRNIENT